MTADFSGQKLGKRPTRKPTSVSLASSLRSSNFFVSTWRLSTWQSSMP
jgi:hypothetical protein